jgi:mRNA m6A methyltransferase catalytic subunit
VEDIGGEPDLETDVERVLLQMFADPMLVLPTNSKQVTEVITKMTPKMDVHKVQQGVLHFIRKWAGKGVLNVKEVSINSETGFEIIHVDQVAIQRQFSELMGDNDLSQKSEDSLKRKRKAQISILTSPIIFKFLFSVSVEEETDDSNSRIIAGYAEKKPKKEVVGDQSDIMSLLSMPSTREKQNKQVGEEILELLSKQTAKEKSLVEKFKSQGGAQVMEFCPHGTRSECERAMKAESEETAASVVVTIETVVKVEAKTEIEPDKAAETPPAGESATAEATTSAEPPVKPATKPVVEPTRKCFKLHFKKIIQSHTDPDLGDCSFLNTCFHMDSCKYVHYEVDNKTTTTTAATISVKGVGEPLPRLAKQNDQSATLYPPQWIQCDLRFLDMTVLGKFAVVMADPPWDIHMELPYGTMSDDEMRQLGVPALQDDGLIFLWVTGRAMELGRECLKLWGYERVDELIWVKTNQLQRIIRTGRTGHWLNHGKEHCLVGLKGNPTNLNRGLDCDVIVAEVRATSHKPDEIYGIIERLSPGTRKIELFGRPHNVQPNW